VIVLCITAQLHLAWCRSLKEKRAQAQSLTSRLRQRFNVSVAQSGSQDKHQLLTLSLAALAFDAAQADSIAQNLYDFVLGNSQGELLVWEVEHR